MSWLADIQRYIKKSTIKVDGVPRAVGIEMEALAILASPVDTGQFRNNWNVSIGSPDTQTKEGENPGYPQPEAPAKLADSKAGDTVYVTNALPYARRIDEGWSDQAPRGITTQVLERVRSAVGGKA